MSLQNNIVVVSNDLIKECAANAVFTVSQIKEIVRLSLSLDRVLIEAIEHICLPDEIGKLIEYDEHNTIIVSTMKRDIENLEKEVSCIEHKLNELSQNTAAALLSQANELNELEQVVKNLVRKEVIEDIVRRLSIQEHRDMKDCRVEKIIENLEEFLRRIVALERKEIHDTRVDSLIKRIAVLEAKEIHDARVDALLRKIKSMEEVNENQSKHICELTAENNKQKEQIECLNEKLNRNIIALDNKIDQLERKETLDVKVDLEQNAALKFLQAEHASLKADFERLERTLLLNSCNK